MSALTTDVKNLQNHRNMHHVQFVREVSPSTFVLCLERNDLEFAAGQHISVGLENSTNMREYSIYSAEDDEYLELLIKDVEDGVVSKRLHRCAEWEPLRVDGPLGDFALPANSADRPLLFVATGTGISPFHSMILSNPNLNYTLLHGVRDSGECYDVDDYARDRYVPCLSRERCDAAFTGRVTDWLRSNDVPAGTACFLCGNCDMIYDAFEILQEKGIPRKDIYAEIYF